MNCKICSQPMQELLVSCKCYNPECGKSKPNHNWYMVADKHGTWYTVMSASLVGTVTYYVLVPSVEIALKRWPTLSEVYVVTLKEDQVIIPFLSDLYGIINPPDKWELAFKA